MSIKNDSIMMPAGSADTSPSVQTEYSFGRRLPLGAGTMVCEEETGTETSKYSKEFDRIKTGSLLKNRTAELLLASLFRSDSTVMTHSKNVSTICEAIAMSMNLPHTQVSEIKIAGILHDAGKAEISETVLNKLERLDNDEWSQIKQHSAIGCRIVKTLNGFSGIANVILEHHERWDGKGYPRGLSGSGISLQARIIAVADTFDAMTSDRPYKKAVSRDEAIAEIQANAGTQFDPAVVGAFLDAFKQEVMYA